MLRISNSSRIISNSGTSSRYLAIVSGSRSVRMACTSVYVMRALLWITPSCSS
jgi:hypothetical protein